MRSDGCDMGVNLGYPKNCKYFNPGNIPQNDDSKISNYSR